MTMIGPSELATLKPNWTDPFGSDADAIIKKVEPPQKAADPSGFALIPAPTPQVSAAVNAGTDTLRPQSPGQTRYLPITDALVTRPAATRSSDTAPTPAEQRVLKVIDQKPVAAEEKTGRKVEYLKNGTPEGHWARDLLAKIDPSTKDLPYEEAFKKYQEARKLRKDGMPGPETLRKLKQDGLGLPAEAKNDALSKRFFAHAPAGEAPEPSAKAVVPSTPATEPAKVAVEPTAKGPEAAPPPVAAAPAPGAPEPKAADATPRPARSPADIDREISAKELEVRALRGWGDPASDPIRREKIDALKTASKALVATPEYKAVLDLRAQEKQLKDLRSDWVWPGAEPYHAERIRAAQAAVAKKQQDTQGFRDRVERDEARIRDDLVALSYPTLTEETRQRFQPQIATLNQQIATLRSELGSHPGASAYADYASAKAALAALESGWVKSGAEVERMDVLRGIVRGYEAKP